MKLPFLLSLIFVLSGISGQSQIIYDTIPYNKVILNEDITFNTNESILNKFHGSPDSIKQYLDVCDDNEPYYKKYYELDIFEIKDHKIRGFKIRSSKFQLKFHSISVGDSASILKILFPHAYSRKITTTENEYLISVYIGINDQQLIFTIRDEIIIEYRSYYPC